MNIDLLSLNDLTDDLQGQIATLYKQLNATNDQIAPKQVLSSGNNVVLAVCRIDGQVAGIALLATYKVISGHRGMVEDVVVDASQRGKGIGRKLMEKLLEEAKNRKLNEILLFTGHHRLAAINLYKSLGFTLRESGLYNMKL